MPDTKPLLSDGKLLSVRHRDHVAFYVRQDIRPEDALRSADVLLPDGSIPASASPIACGTCGEILLGLQHHMPRGGMLTWAIIGEQLDFVRGG